VLHTIIKLYRDYKPLGFFGLCGIILAIIAVVMFIPILISYMETGLVLRFPTLFVCGFIGLAALQSLFAGLILSNMALKNRRDFEYRLTLVTRKVRKSEESR
jgi:predicted RND superfamily exporter protein